MPPVPDTAVPSTPLLRQALGYRRFRGPRRVLLLDSGYYTVADLRDAARSLGFAVAALRCPSGGALSSEFIAALLSALVAHRPDYLVTVNHAGLDRDGAVAELLAAYDLPLASWFVDHPLPILGPAPAGPRDHIQVFCLERRALPYLRRVGFGDPRHLPTAARERPLCGPPLPPAPPERLTLVGHSWWSRARGVDPVLRDAGAALADAAEAPGFLETAAASATPLEVLEVALAEASLRRRVALCQALAPLDLSVFGDAGWDGLLPPGVARRPEVEPDAALPALFAASAINVNRSAAQLPTAVNQRLWDVPAAGGFLLTDAQEDALAYFRPDVSLCCYADLDEATAKARHYLARPAAAAALAAAARAEVRRHHRYPHRLRVLDEAMTARFG